MENNKLPSNKNDDTPGIFQRLVDTIIGIGLGESLLRAGTTILSISLLVVVVWLLRLFYAQGVNPVQASTTVLETVPTLPVEGANAGVQPVSLDSFWGIPRRAQVHTTIPSRPRQDVEKYTVVKGDTIFGIA